MMAFTMNSAAQEDRYDTITDSIAKKVKLLTNYAYDNSGIEIDKSVNNQSVSHGKIKDPYGTLAGCFIFLAEDTDDPLSTRPKGFIGIYRVKSDSIIWRSALLSNEFADGVSGSVDATDELNRDGKVEIVIGQTKGTGGQLWIFSWDGTEGKLITQLDNDGDSNIMYWGDDYDLKDVNGNGIYEIQGEWYKGDGSDAKVKVRYTWNGSLFGNWGKASQVFPSSKKK
jgi:hypothetical protein